MSAAPALPSLSIFGLGYVGCVSAACFSARGLRVIGVDVASSKVDLVGSGKATIIEEGIQELVAAQHAVGRLTATTSAADAVHGSDVSMICVGTPSRTSGEIDLTYIVRVLEEIGQALRTKSGYHLVVMRSTVPPGTIRSVVVPVLERESGKRSGLDFGVASNPEFLREGSSIRDFNEPPFTILGVDDDQAETLLRDVYASVPAPVFRVTTDVAEMVKYTCNAFHALKVTFANEIGAVCAAHGVDSHEVMRLVCEDRKLNISPAYLRPGLAFGGSCLPKDVRALGYRAKQVDCHVPLVDSLMESNRLQIEQTVQRILGHGQRRIGMLGLSFKAGTDDLRESPLVSIAERLIGKGVELRIYDAHVSEAGLLGANREYIEREIPHIWKLMAPSIDAVLESSDVVVIGNGAPEFRSVPNRIREGQVLYDLVRVQAELRSDGKSYAGLYW